MERRREQIFFDDPSRTKQAFKQSCDINWILARFKSTGLIPHVNRLQGFFSDVSDVGDYQSSLVRVRKAQAEFDALPSRIRSRFHNDPGELLSFLSDSKNRDEAVALGLVNKREKLPRKPVDTTDGVPEKDPTSGSGAPSKK